MNRKILVFIFLIAGASAREVELGSFTPSRGSDQDFIDYGTVRVTKVKKNQFKLSGDFELKKNIGNDKTLVFEIYMPSGGLLASNVRPFCDFTKTDKLIWPDLVKASNLPQSDPCPFPKGNYTIKNFAMDDTKFGPLPPGKYLAKGKLMDNSSKQILTSMEISALVTL